MSSTLRTWGPTSPSPSSHIGHPWSTNRQSVGLNTGLNRKHKLTHVRWSFVQQQHNFGKWVCLPLGVPPSCMLQEVWSPGYMWRNTSDKPVIRTCYQVVNADLSISRVWKYVLQVPSDMLRSDFLHYPISTGSCQPEDLFLVGFSSILIDSYWFSSIPIEIGTQYIVHLSFLRHNAKQTYKHIWLIWPLGSSSTLPGHAQWWFPRTKGLGIFRYISGASVAGYMDNPNR